MKIDTTIHPWRVDAFGETCWMSNEFAAAEQLIVMNAGRAARGGTVRNGKTKIGYSDALLLADAGRRRAAEELGRALEDPRRAGLKRIA